MFVNVSDSREFVRCKKNSISDFVIASCKFTLAIYLSYRTRNTSDIKISTFLLFTNSRFFIFIVHADSGFRIQSRMKAINFFYFKKMTILPLFSRFCHSCNESDIMHMFRLTYLTNCYYYRIITIMFTFDSTYIPHLKILMAFLMTNLNK